MGEGAGKQAGRPGTHRPRSCPGTKAWDHGFTGGRPARREWPPPGPHAPCWAAGRGQGTLLGWTLVPASLCAILEPSGRTPLADRWGAGLSEQRVFLAATGRVRPVPGSCRSRPWFWLVGAGSVPLGEAMCLSGGLSSEPAGWEVATEDTAHPSLPALRPVCPVGSLPTACPWVPPARAGEAPWPWGLGIYFCPAPCPVPVFSRNA